MTAIAPATPTPEPSPLGWYLLVLKRYVQFEGRARRKEYWYFVLFSIIASLLLSGIDRALHTTSGNGSGVLSSLYSLAVLLPSIAVGVRRLHDTSRTGWWILIGLIPIVGFIVLLVFFCQDSDAGTNAYGPNPKLPGTFVPPVAGPAAV